MDISRILQARQALARSVFAEQSQQQPDPSAIVYTFAGYGPGNTCTIKTASGQTVPAKLQTNGFISVGSQVCVIDTGEGLIVKMMPAPPPVEPDDTAPIEQYKIKILWTIGTDLWMGGDRSKPKLIHKFPAGTVIRGLCHNQGDGDRFAIGVVASLGDKHEQWTWKGSPKQVWTCVQSDFKTARIQPIGHGVFAEPWMPPNMIDRKFLALSKKNHLFFIGNNQTYLVNEYQAPVKAIVNRKAKDDYSIVVDVGTAKTEFTASTFTDAKKAKWHKWVFLLPDDLTLDRIGAAFKDKHLTGTSIVSASRNRRDLKIKAWKVIKAAFEQMTEIWTRTENSFFNGTDTREKHIAKGWLSAGETQVIGVDLKRTVDRRPVGYPGGDNLPPAGDDPTQPYKDRYFSFVWGRTPTEKVVGPFGSLTVEDNAWTRYSSKGSLTESFTWYPWHFNHGWPLTPFQHYSAHEPQWQIEGIYLTSMPVSQFLSLVDSYRGAYNSIPRISLADVRSLLPSWLPEDAFDSYYRYNTNYWEPNDLMLPIFRYLDKYGKEQYRGGQWSNLYRGYRAIGWKGYSFLNSGLPVEPPNRPDGEPVYEPWAVDDYKWRDPIVVAQNGDVLVKQWVESDYTGRAPLPPAKISSRQIILLTNKGAKETTIKGDLPLLTAEDQLIGTKLYRVDRSPLEPPTVNAAQPTRSTIRRLPVEIYALGLKTTRSIKTEKIYPVPQEAIVLSASCHP